MSYPPVTTVVLARREDAEHPDYRQFHIATAFVRPNPTLRHHDRPVPPNKRRRVDTSDYRAVRANARDRGDAIVSHSPLKLWRRPKLCHRIDKVYVMEAKDVRYLLLDNDPTSPIGGER